MSAPIPDFLLERLRLDELDPVAAARLRDRMSPADEARLEAMRTDDARLLDDLPPRVVAAEVDRRRQGRARSMSWLLVPALAMAAAAALFALRPAPETTVAQAPIQASQEAPTEITRAKGDDRLLVFRRAADGEELLEDGAPARPGDLLQLALVLTADRHAVIMSVDGRGAVTTHFPTAARPDPIEAGRHALDHAFALDDAPRYERFVLVTAAAPIDAAQVRDALIAAGDGPLELPERWQQDSVLVRKEQP